MATAPPPITSFLAAGYSCGAVLGLLSLLRETGVMASIWLGFAVGTLVAFGLLALRVLLSLIPGAAVAAWLAVSSVWVSVAVWVAFAATVLFVANAVADPRRIWDFGFVLPFGALYGGVMGIVFWGTSRALSTP